MSEYEERYGYYENNEYHDCQENDEKVQVVEIPVQVYHGLKKAQEIVRRRACQQVKGSEVDAHGYRFLGAEKAYCKQKKAYEWKITKLSPYSTQINLDEVRKLIVNDLREFYHLWTDLLEPDLRDKVDKMLTMNEDERVKKTQPVQKQAGGMWFPSYETAHIPWLKAYNLLAQHEELILYDICKLRFNFQLGLYEVTYWANDIF